VVNPQSLYDAEYFAAYGDDTKRQEMYQQECQRLYDLVWGGGSILDIGCGLGDFLYTYDPGHICDWYGIEVSDHAREIAKQRGVRFYWPDRPDKFDLIILRGSIQHLDKPLQMLHNAYAWLKPGGTIAFLATPNSESIVYRLFSDLPALHPDYNYWIPGARELANVLKHIGFGDIETVYPYLNTPYAHPLRDAWRFLLRLIGVKQPFAWPENMMEIYARKI